MKEINKNDIPIKENTESKSMLNETNEKHKKIDQEIVQTIRKSTTIIDRVIANFLLKCMKDKSIPSPEQVRSIEMLIKINREHTVPMQTGISRDALDTINRERFIAGKNFEFKGSPDNIMVKIPKYV